MHYLKHFDWLAHFDWLIHWANQICLPPKVEECLINWYNYEFAEPAITSNARPYIGQQPCEDTEQRDWSTSHVNKGPGPSYVRPNEGSGALGYRRRTPQLPEDRPPRSLAKYDATCWRHNSYEKYAYISTATIAIL